SGVLATNINGWLSIQLPRIESEEESQEVMSVLNDLQERHPGTAHWVVDLASSSYCPVSLLAYLVGLKQSIQPRAAKMTLLWLRSDAIPEPLAEAITSNFKLMRKGSYLISKIN
ncbi:MAG: hypothetical protein DCC75_05360, partial [Proteobacteria bacterium]